ncbi:MAG: hypothetical protein JW790_03655 [Dehalococcoidales bacterium]|nr:hypothetical protein [Dehalococcoidales bacterium]
MANSYATISLKTMVVKDFGDRIATRGWVASHETTSYRRNYGGAMRRRLPRSVSDVLTILLSAAIGAFAWVHGQKIFNEGIRQPNWGKGICEAFVSDITGSPPAWGSFLGAVIILFFVLRNRVEDDVDTVILLRLIAKKLDISDSDIQKEKDRENQKKTLDSAIKKSDNDAQE